MVDRGFIRVPRSLLNDPLFGERVPYTRLHAWLDIVGGRARGVANGLARGQFRASLTVLAEAWCWDRERVRRFLETLQRERRLQLVEPGNRGTGAPAVYAVMEFGQYNGEKPKSAQQAENTLFDTGSDTAPDTGSDTAKPTQAAGSDASAPQPPPQHPTQGPTHIKEEKTKENVRERTILGDRGHKTSAPAELPIVDAMRAWAKGKGITANLEEETEAMLDHFRGKGETRKDWVATWRTWMRNTKKFGERHGERQFGEQAKIRRGFNAVDAVVRRVAEKTRGGVPG